MKRLQKTGKALAQLRDWQAEQLDANDRMAIAGWMAIGVGVWQWSPAAAAVVCGALLLLAGAFGASRSATTAKPRKDS